MNWAVVRVDRNDDCEVMLIVEDVPGGIGTSQIRRALQEAGYDLVKRPGASLFFVSEPFWPQPVPDGVMRINWASLPAQRRAQTTIRLEPEELAMLREAAGRTGLSMNDWMVGTLLDVAKRELDVPESRR